MKIYYCVTSSFDNRGRMKASLTNQIESEGIPENSLYSAFEKDIYTNWFESKAEAMRFILEVNGFDKKVGWSITKPTETIMQFVEENKLHKVSTCYRVEVKPEKKKTSSTKKYTCPQCGSVVRATKTVHILCADCKMLMECDD